MKICFFGLGSIGRRHLKNLHAITAEKNISLEIHAFRNSARASEKDISTLISKEVYSEKDLPDDYDAVFITNPTNMHYKTIQLIQNKTKNIFIEKPLFDDRHYNLKSLEFKTEGTYYVAGPLRYNNVIQKLKDIVNAEKIYSIRAICSSYLPDWRPEADYRKIYSANREQGGGVTLDLIHEWDYITYLFGFPHRIQSLSGKFSHLEINTEDLAIYIAQYQDKLVELHLDYFGRKPRREIELLTETGTIIGDIIGGTISFTDGRDTIVLGKETNDMYIKEMDFFLNKVINNVSFSNIEHCYKVLILALGRDMQ